MGLSLIFQAFRSNKLGVCFVDGVIRQVHEHVFVVFPCRFVVWLSGESDESLFEDVNRQRREAGDDHIEPHVEFESFDEHGVPQVLLDHKAGASAIENLFEILRHEYSFSLARGLWLHNVESGMKGFGRVSWDCWLVGHHFERLNLQRVEPSLREKLVVAWKLLFHSQNGAIKKVFATQNPRAWKVVDFLGVFEALDDVMGDVSIAPNQIGFFCD